MDRKTFFSHPAINHPATRALATASMIVGGFAIFSSESASGATEKCSTKIEGVIHDQVRSVTLGKKALAVFINEVPYTGEKQNMLAAYITLDDASDNEQSVKAASTSWGAMYDDGRTRPVDGYWGPLQDELQESLQIPGGKTVELHVDLGKDTAIISGNCKQFS